MQNTVIFFIPFTEIEPQDSGFPAITNVQEGYLAQEDLITITTAEKLEPHRVPNRFVKV